MKRKEIRVGLRVVPSGKGFTKYWNLSQYIGTVEKIGQRYIIVKWDGLENPDTNLMPVCLSSEKESPNG